MTDEAEPQNKIQVSAIYTETGVNMGDHAQDIQRAIEVGENETVAELVDRVLVFHETWGRAQSYDNFIVLRVVKPMPIQAPSPEQVDLDDL